MTSIKFACASFVVALLLLMPTCFGQTFETSGILDGKIQVKIVPDKLYDGRLIGFKIYTVTESGELGTAFFSSDAFYSLSEGELVHDQVFYRTEGILDGEVVKLNNLYESSKWQSDDLTEFRKITEEVNKGGLTIDEQKNIYALFGGGFGIMQLPKVFTKQKSKGNPDEKEVSWGLGLLKIDDQEVIFNRSKKYSNLFQSAFAN